MLDSIDRSRVRKGDKIKNISKMIAETMNDGDLLNFIWDLLGQNDEMLREFEYLATHADMPGWRKRLEDFAENLNQELLSCEDVNHDEKNNNVVWNILRPAKHQQKVTRMPVSHHWLGLSIAGILRSINRNLV